MDDQALLDELNAAVEALREAGDSWWPGEQLAPVALRRWRSFSRRNKAKQPTDEMRVIDLAKGLQAHYEPDFPYTHPTDWRHLATALAGVLSRDG